MKLNLALETSESEEIGESVVSLEICVTTCVEEMAAELIALTLVVVLIDKAGLAEEWVYEEEEETIISVSKDEECVIGNLVSDTADMEEVSVVEAYE